MPLSNLPFLIKHNKHFFLSIKKPFLPDFKNGKPLGYCQSSGLWSSFPVNKSPRSDPSLRRSLSCLTSVTLPERGAGGHLLLSGPAPLPGGELPPQEGHQGVCGLGWVGRVVDGIPGRMQAMKSPQEWLRSLPLTGPVGGSLCLRCQGGGCRLLVAKAVLHRITPAPFIRVFVAIKTISSDCLTRHLLLLPLCPFHGQVGCDLGVCLSCDTLINNREGASGAAPSGLLHTLPRPRKSQAEQV